MVLQQAPQAANVFGFAPPGVVVFVFLDQSEVGRALANNLTGQWLVTLPPTKGSTSRLHTIEVATSENASYLETPLPPIRLDNVLFGEVWVG